MREIDVAGGVDQIQLIGLAVGGAVLHRDGITFDRDSALTFDIHRVEHLGVKFAIGYRAASLNQSIGQR